MRWQFTEQGRPTSGTATFDHVAFACSGLTNFKQRLDAHEIKYSCERVPVTGQVQLFFDDPAGNRLELNFAVSEDHD